MIGKGKITPEIENRETIMLQSQICASLKFCEIII